MAPYPYITHRTKSYQRQDSTNTKVPNPTPCQITPDPSETLSFPRPHQTLSLIAIQGIVFQKKGRCITSLIFVPSQIEAGSS